MEDTRLDASEIATLEAELQDCDPAQMALAIYMVEQTTLPISPSLAALVSRYIAKVGLTIFCKYTESQKQLPGESA